MFWTFFVCVIFSLESECLFGLLGEQSLQQPQTNHIGLLGEQSLQCDFFYVPLWRGLGGGCNKHLRHFVTPPPAEDTYKVCPSCGLRFVCRPLEANCVAILLCHYETPLRRRGNLMSSWTYEIASVVSLPRNDMRSVIFVYCVFWFYLPASIIIILKKEKIQWLFMMNENLVCLLRRAVCWFSGNAFQAKLFTDGCDGGGLICFSHKA